MIFQQMHGDKPENTIGERPSWREFRVGAAPGLTPSCAQQPTGPIPKPSRTNPSPKIGASTGTRAGGPPDPWISPAPRMPAPGHNPRLGNRTGIQAYHRHFTSLSASSSAGHPSCATQTASVPVATPKTRISSPCPVGSAQNHLSRDEGTPPHPWPAPVSPASSHLWTGPPHLWTAHLMSPT